MHGRRSCLKYCKCHLKLHRYYHINYIKMSKSHEVSSKGISITRTRPHKNTFELHHENILYNIYLLCMNFSCKNCYLTDQKGKLQHKAILSYKANHTVELRHTSFWSHLHVFSCKKKLVKQHRLVGLS